MKRCTRLRNIITLCILGLALSLSACGQELDAQTQEETDITAMQSLVASTPQQADHNDKGVYENLVINDFPVEDGEYLIEKGNGSTYILLSEEIITYALKLPNSNDYYPELSLENGQISMTWKMNGEVFLKIDMVEGSREAYMNDSNEPIEINVAPKTVDDQLYIPINLMLQGLGMKETYNKDLNTTFLHYEKIFSKETLVGCWSDSETNCFTDYEKAREGIGSLGSFATGYQFNADGTYQVLLLGVGGFDDKMILCKGTYEILGNTLIYQNIEETLYEGNPLELVHQNEKLEFPVYEFIDNYDKTRDQISINGFLLNRIN